MCPADKLVLQQRTGSALQQDVVLVHKNKKMLFPDTFIRCAGIVFPQQSQTQSAPGQRVVAERRWRLGVHSRGHPHRIIEDLLRALHALSVGYKKVAPYNYKCRKLYPARGEPCYRPLDHMYYQCEVKGTFQHHCCSGPCIPSPLSTRERQLVQKCRKPYAARWCVLLAHVSSTFCLLPATVPCHAGWHLP